MSRVKSRCGEYALATAPLRAAKFARTRNLNVPIPKNFVNVPAAT